MLFFPDDSMLLRGPKRRANTLYMEGCLVLSKYFDLVTGSCTVQAKTLAASAFNAVPASGWLWQSYDKICTAYNTIDVSGGGLVASGLGSGTTVVSVLNGTPIVCTAFLVDAPPPAIPPVSPDGSDVVSPDGSTVVSPG